MEGTTARIGLVTAHLPQEIQQGIAEEATRAALTVPGVADVLLQIGKPPQSKKVRTGVPTPEEIPGILHVVAVASGKGGVAKAPSPSTWRQVWLSQGCVSACWMLIFMAPMCRVCWA